MNESDQKTTLKNVQAFTEGESVEVMISQPMVSACCSSYERAGFDEDTGLCAACGEHCEFVTEGEFYE